MVRYIHGSEDSIDVDVFYVFDTMPSFQECQEFCSDKNENRNIIVINNGIVTDCYKGTPDEINNGLYITYPLHNQEYPCKVTKLVERDVLIKMVRVLRCLLSHCSRTQYRSTVKKALNSSSWKEKVEILKSIDFTTIDDYGKKGNREDVLKIFAFQLGQFLALFNGIELFTKSSIATFFPNLKDFLYRKTDTDIAILLDFIDVFLRIASIYCIDEHDGLCTFKDFNKTINLKLEQYV